MEGISSDSIKFVNFLLPGLVAAWVYHSLTAHPVKPTPFERIVQALVFTTFVNAIVIMLRELLLLGGSHFIGSGADPSAVVTSVIVAIVFGLFFARAANNDNPHRWLRHWDFYEKYRGKLKKFRWLRWLPAWEWTQRTSYPSQWFGAFRKYKTWATLHLKDQRRVYGWAEEWPDHPEIGQFLIEDPRWLLDDGTCTPAPQSLMLIPVSMVEFVEFVRPEAESPKVSGEEVKKSEKTLIHINKENSNGIETPATSPK
jgi:hypothetical protein